MSTPRTTGRRRTVIRDGDRRVVGRFEPDCWSYKVIACVGRFGQRGGLDHVALLGLARLRSNGELVVEMVDLLAAVGLECEAEVVVFTDATDEQLAVPARKLAQCGRLILGPVGALRRPSELPPPRLELAEWTELDNPFHPVSMSARAFAEFISCR